MWDVEDEAACDICGRPALLILDADKPCPWHLCEEHMPQRWRDVFRGADAPMEPCVVCGARSVIREIDFVSVTPSHYGARHAPADAEELTEGALRRH